METLTSYLAVAAGGALGAMARYYLGGSALARAAAPFPTATFVINVTGSFILGLFLTLVTEHISVSPQLRLAEDVPMRIEAIDSEQKITALLPFLYEMIGSGLIEVQETEVIKYTHSHPTDEASGSEDDSSER